MSRSRRSSHTPAANGSKWIRPSRRWAIYLRDGFACVYCERVGKLSIDHVVPCEAGGTHRSNNLVTCCMSCNSSKQGLSNRKWYAKLRERGIDTNRMRHRIARLLRKPLDRKRGRFLASTRKKRMDDETRKSLKKGAKSFPPVCVPTPAGTRPDSETALSGEELTHGSGLRWNDIYVSQASTETDTVVQALSKILPPRYVPPKWVIDDWVGAARHACIEWAEQALRARLHGGREPDTPHALREYMRWGTGTVLTSCKAAHGDNERPCLLFTSVSRFYQVFEDGTVIHGGRLGITPYEQHQASSQAEAIDWVLKQQGG